MTVLIPSGSLNDSVAFWNLPRALTTWLKVSGDLSSGKPMNKRAVANRISMNPEDVLRRLVNHAKQLINSAWCRD